MFKYQKWKEGIAKDISFIVTDKCQLACKYCYEVKRSNKEDMNKDVAKAAIDFCLRNDDIVDKDAVIWNFIGGEPLIKMDLISWMADYIIEQTSLLKHKWKDDYIFSFATNGLLYSSDIFKEFLNKHKNHSSISISIDGNEDKHDKQRIYPNGKGSYKEVIKNVKNWISDFNFTSVKATISHEDLSDISDSIIFLFELGVSYVHMNVVYEDVWHEGDPDLFEQQLYNLADRIIDGGFYQKQGCSIFDESIGSFLPKVHTKNWCGTGSMLAIDQKGLLYPCIRFKDFSLKEKKSRSIGTIETGINKNLLRPFNHLNRAGVSSNECLTCQVASGCGWCQGNCYENSRTDTIFHRTTFICQMHKARVKANNYYWSKLNCLEKIWEGE